MTHEPTGLTPPPAVADAVATLARRCAARGWVPATSGNFSVRIDAGAAAITMSGVDKAELQPAQVLRLPLVGELPANASAEAPLHRALYSRFSDVGAIAHVHSITTTLASMIHAETGRIVLADLELLKAFRGVSTHATSMSVPVIPNTQDMGALGAAVSAGRVQLGDAPALLLSGHGAYVWGRDAAEAYRHLDALDFLLTMMLHPRMPKP